MITMERRRAPRTRLRELVYIGMGNDNGGVVLDVSEGGLAFHAVASIQQTSPIQFSLSVDGNRRIEGIAEVAWNSTAGKCAGLRFTHLPEEVREQIQIWSNQPRVNWPADAHDIQLVETKAAPWSTDNSAPVGPNQPGPAATSLSAAMCEQAPSLSTASDVSRERVGESGGAVADLEATEDPVVSQRLNPLSMFPQEPTRESGGGVSAARYSVPSKHSFVAIFLTMILAFVVTIGGLSYAYLHGAGKYLLHLGEKIWGWF